MIVVADTSALLAAFDESEAEHDRARVVMASEQLVISPLCLPNSITWYIGISDLALQWRLVESLTDRVADGDYALAAVSNDDLIAAGQIRSGYSGLELDLADGLESSSQTATAPTGSSHSTCGTFVRSRR